MLKFNNGQLLENVLFAPDAANLIPISATTKKGAKFVFAADIIYVGKSIFRKIVSNALYECLLLIGSITVVSFNIPDHLGHSSTSADPMLAIYYVVSNEIHSNCASCH